MEAWMLIPVAVVALIALVGLVASGVSSRCAACGKWWATTETGRNEIGREHGVKTVKRTDVRKDATGKIVESVEREEPIGVLRITYDTTVRCKHCGHEARRTLVEEQQVAAPPGRTGAAPRMALTGERRPETCALCGGNGRRYAERCPSCTGTGTVLVAAPFRRCSECDGRGRKYADSCHACSGSGWADAVPGGP